MADEARLVIELQDKSGAPGSAAQFVGNPGSPTVPGASIAQDFQTGISQTGAGARAGAGSTGGPSAADTPSGGATPRGGQIGQATDLLSDIFAAGGGPRLLGQLFGPVGQAVGGFAQVSLREAWRLEGLTMGQAAGAPSAAEEAPIVAELADAAQVASTAEGLNRDLASAMSDPLYEATRGILEASPATTAEELGAALGVTGQRASTLLKSAQAATTAATTTAGVAGAAATGAPILAEAIGGTAAGGGLAGILAAGAPIAAGVAVVAAAASIPIAATVAAFNEAERAKALTPYSPEALQAQAIADVRQVMATIRTSERLGDEVGRYTEASSRLSAASQGIRDVVSERVLQKLDGILEKLVPLVEWGDAFAQSEIGGFLIQGSIDALLEAAFKAMGIPSGFINAILAVLPKMDPDRATNNPFMWFANQKFLPPPKPFSADPATEDVVGTKFAPIPGLDI